MSDSHDVQHTNTLSNGVRIAFGVSGIVAVLLGVLILIAPLKTASIITAIIALYAVVSGVVYLSIGIFAKKFGGWKRIGHAVLGALFLVVGVIAFTDLGNSTAIVATIVAIMIGVAWVVEGVVALMTIGQAARKLWIVLYAAVSIVAGIIVLFAPFSFAAVLWLVLGIALIVLGIVQIVRGFSFDAAKMIPGA